MLPIMVDETTDLSNTDQMVEHANVQLDVHEEVFSQYSLESISADSIVFTIKDVLLWLNLYIVCLGQ